MTHPGNPGSKGNTTNIFRHDPARTTQAQLAKFLGCDPRYVRDAMKAAGIERRVKYVSDGGMKFYYGFTEAEVEKIIIQVRARAGNYVIRNRGPKGPKP